MRTWTRAYKVIFGLQVAALLGSSWSTGAWASGVRIVSDIDDTVKVSHVGSLDSAARAIFSRKSFAGMAPLYRHLLSDYERTDIRLHFVSGGPRFLADFVDGFLVSNGFPLASVSMRNVLAQPGLVEHKTVKIRKLLEDHPDDTFLMFGDDTQSDPEVYRTFLQEGRASIPAVYIRQIRGTGAAEGEIPIYTALDIALREVAAHRLTAEQASGVAGALMASPDDEAVIPDFAACPTDSHWLDQLLAAPEIGPEEREKLTISVSLVQSRVQRICSGRRH